MQKLSSFPPRCTHPCFAPFENQDKKISTPENFFSQDDDNPENSFEMIPSHKKNPESF